MEKLTIILQELEQGRIIAANVTWLWMQIRYWQPYKIKRIISKKETVDELPF